MPVTMEPTLRKLGLPVRLLDGKIVLPAECVVCKAGDALTPEQCKILVCRSGHVSHSLRRSALRLRRYSRCCGCY